MDMFLDMQYGYMDMFFYFSSFCITERNGLGNFDAGLTKEHSCEII